jgi:probable HAF family extracellular repeat protein
MPQITGGVQCEFRKLKRGQERHEMKIQFLIAVVGMALAASSSAQGVVRLETLGGTGSIARDINDLGQIVGESTLAGDTVSHATIWNSGVATDLNAVEPSGNSVAWAINNLGVAVGSSDLASGIRTATMFESRGLIDVGAAAGSVNGNSVAWDINDNGLVAGQATINPGFARGFFWDPSNGGVAAGTLYQGGANLSINNSGVSVGHSFFFGDPNTATISIPDGRGGYQVGEIGPSGLTFSIASAISNTGLVVGHTNGAGLGSSGDSGDWQAVMYEEDGRGGTNYIPLGRLPGLSISEANDVNDSGLVVGYAFDGTGSGLAPRAFAWNDGTMYDLNDFLDSRSEFVNLLQATGVNENGDIVGFGETLDGQLAGFVINGFVPSPATGSTLVFAGLLAARRRRN